MSRRITETLAVLGRVLADWDAEMCGVCPQYTCGVWRVLVVAPPPHMVVIVGPDTDIVLRDSSPDRIRQHLIAAGAPRLSLDEVES